MLIFLKDDVASSIINIPFLDWRIRFKWPSVSYVDATDIIVPGLAGMALNLPARTVFKLRSRCPCPCYRKWLDDAATTRGFGICSRYLTPILTMAVIMTKSTLQKLLNESKAIFKIILTYCMIQIVGLKVWVGIKPGGRKKNSRKQ
jgi:hypothetical protein